MWWLPVIERPGHAKDDYRRFLLLEQAVAWLEQAVPEFHAQDEERKKNRNVKRPEKKRKIRLYQEN